jgi:hypothetical protein
MRPFEDIQSEDLEVYEDLPNFLEDGAELGSIAEEFGASKTSHHVSDGTLIDGENSAIYMRESRIYEAEHEYSQFFGTSLADLLEPTTKLVVSGGIPVICGFHAVNSGGEPYWVGLTGATSFASKEFAEDSIEELGGEITKISNKLKAAKRYRFKDQAYEDFKVTVLDKDEFYDQYNELDSNNNMCEIREVPGITVYTAKS